jgi:anti-anti-sigma factor
MAQGVCFSSDMIGPRTQVLTLDGHCDDSGAIEAERRILAALSAGRTEIILDLRGVISIDPATLNVLFRGLVGSAASNGNLLLIRPNASVWTAFETSGLDRVFSTTIDLKDALARGSGRPIREAPAA